MIRTIRYYRCSCFECRKEWTSMRISKCPKCGSFDIDIKEDVIEEEICLIH